MKDLRIAVSLVPLSLLSLSVVPWEATAATLITTFGVSATVQAMCLMSTTSKMSKSSGEGGAKEVSTVTVTCTNSTPYTVGFSKDVVNDVSVPAKPAKGPAPETDSDDLSSGLYWPEERDEALAPRAEKGIGNGSSHAYNFSGPCSSTQLPASATSCETITATVTY